MGNGKPAPAGVRGEPALPDGLDPEDFYVHKLQPLGLETRRSRISSSIITPASLFFVRNNLPLPPRSIVEHPDQWVLAVRGTKAAGKITLAGLKGLGLDTETVVIQCSGNGRAFFDHGPSGSPWATGAAGCAVWTGVRVSTVVAHFGGPVAGMNYLTSTGGEDLPEGIDADTAIVERSVPVDKGLSDCLLAWEMNGQPIPLTHGGPLRLVVPGYFGCNHIKYVKAIALTEHQSESKIQQKGYRYRPIGASGSPDQPSMWRMPVKSWVNGPGADDMPVLGGKVHFHGVALSGERGIDHVDVSLDGGENWVPAELHGPDMGPNAWRTFRFSTFLEAGETTIMSRATDTHGAVQPRVRDENERGYGYNAWQEAGLTLRVVGELPHETRAKGGGEDEDPARPEPKQVELSDAGRRGRKVFTETAEPACGDCHAAREAGTTGNVGPDLDQLQADAARIEAAVTHGVGIMPSFEATLTPEQITDLARYVVEATR
jgi:DMSO/TMAO reductase YedYZ molybdopterin-dependent catalytic subunit/mono/diheme cytochrome c family protein